MTRTSVLNSKRAVLQFAAPLVLIATTGALASAAAPRNLESDATPITVHVYDYAHVNGKALLAAEKESDGILAGAGVAARWEDCPTSHAAINDFPGCKSSSPGDFTLVLLPNSMADALSKEANALAAEDAVSGSRRASIFYDRISATAGGDTAVTSVLTGRVMAREIGVLLLGKNAASRTGLLQSSWTEDDLSLLAGYAMVFTPEQARQMQTRLIQEAHELQPQTQVATNNPR